MHRLASLRVAVALLVILAVVLALDAQQVVTSEVPRLAALTALTIALVASLYTHRKSFWRRKALLAFHLGMLALVGLGIAQRAVRYEGRMRVIEGEAATFSAGEVRGGARADWVSSHVLSVHEVGSEFWFGTSSRDLPTRVTLSREGVALAEATLRPNAPLVHRGLRVTMLTVRGIAATFIHEPERGPATLGGLYFREYRTAPDAQVEDMDFPTLAPTYTVALQMPRLITDEGPWALVVPPEARVEVRPDDGSPPALLAPGERMRVEDGWLRLHALRPYAGFTVAYDPFEDLIVGLLFFNAAAMALHVVVGRRRRRRRATAP